MELVIETLDDVLPFIVEDTGIIHSRHDGYSVINYVYTLENTFETAIARECRGLKFDPDGRLIARPFHKFFNLGEKRPPQDEPWGCEHVVLSKLDGSMIHPAIVRGELVFMTRMGMSELSREAFRTADEPVRKLCCDMITAGFTPIFEYTSPDNRVVLAYDRPELTLLAVREMRSGNYMAHGDVARLASTYGVAVVSAFDSVSDYSAFWKETRAMEGIEGFVVAFADGHRVKVKADAYALRHKALSGLAHEKNVLAWIAAGATDDILPLLTPDAASLVREYHDNVLAGVDKWESEITGLLTEFGHLPRKDLAALLQKQLDPKLQAVAFRALSGTPAREGLMEVLRRASVNGSKVETIRELFDLQWRPREITE